MLLSTKRIDCATSAAQREREEHDAGQEGRHAQKLAHVDRAPIRAVCVLRKDLWMLIRRHTAWMKLSGTHLQKLSAEYERGCSRRSIISESGSVNEPNTMAFVGQAC